MNVPKFLLTFCIVINIVCFKAHGSSRLFPKMGFAVNRFLMAITKTNISRLARIKMGSLFRFPIKKVQSPVFQRHNHAPMRTVEAHKKQIVPKKFQQKYDKQSYNQQWYKSGYGSPLLGSGIGLSLLNASGDERKNQKESAVQGTVILLTKEDVLKFGRYYKNAFIACALQHVTSTEQEIIEAITTIIELWPHDLHELKQEVLKQAADKLVHNDILVALEKVDPMFIKNVQDAVARAEQEILQAQQAVDQAVVSHVIEPSISALVLGVPLQLLSSINPEEIDNVARQGIPLTTHVLQKSGQIGIETVRTLPNILATGYITKKITSRTLDFLGVKCPDYNANTTNFGYYGCKTCTNLIIPAFVHTLISQPIVSKASESTGIQLTLWDK
jgi:hypothetical protein